MYHFYPVDGIFRIVLFPCIFPIVTVLLLYKFASMAGFTVLNLIHPMDVMLSRHRQWILLFWIMGSFTTAFSGSDEPQDEYFDFLCGMLLDKSSELPGPVRPIIASAEESEFRLVSQAMIRMYQEFVSSQQHNVCVFEPSCSHFGQEAILQYGLVKGVLLTADRLQRCNNFASQYRYGYDQTTGKLHDPVINYQFRDTVRDSLSRSSSGATP